MQATKYVWINGAYVAWDDAKVHVVTHTLHYGAGAFEGIRVYKTAKGTAIFRLKEHIKRLFFSAKAIDMHLPYTEAQVCQSCCELIAKNQLAEGYLRPLAIFGYGNMSVSPEKSPVDLILACWPWGAYLPFDMVDLKISKYPRIPPNATVNDAKLCGNYLNGILAVNELRGTKYHEVLLLDSQGHVAEGSGENFFMVKGGKLYTPALGAILPGITRATIIALAGDLGLSVSEEIISPAQAFSADEAFFTGTAAEVTPIRSIDDHLIGDGKLGPITKQLKERYLDTTKGLNSKYAGYLSYV